MVANCARGALMPPAMATTGLPSLEDQLASSGLEIHGCCERLTGLGDEFLQTSALLQDMTPAEVDILGSAMLLVRAQPGQVMIREGESGEWMMLILKGTVDVTRSLATALAFSLADPIARVLGKTGINVMTRLMGLILAALAVEVMADGLGKMFPLLKG